MVENLETFHNRKGFPIIRRCFNCRNWSPYSDTDNQPLGYCKMNPMYFAFTLQKTVFAITKDFYLCELHKFKNEETLAQVSDRVRLKDAIKRKEDIIPNDRVQEDENH